MYMFLFSKFICLLIDPSSRRDFLSYVPRPMATTAAATQPHEDKPSFVECANEFHLIWILLDVRLPQLDFIWDVFFFISFVSFRIQNRLYAQSALESNSCLSMPLIGLGPYNPQFCICHANSDRFMFLLCFHRVAAVVSAAMVNCNRRYCRDCDSKCKSRSRHIIQISKSTPLPVTLCVPWTLFDRNYPFLNYSVYFTSKRTYYVRLNLAKMIDGTRTESNWVFFS